MYKNITGMKDILPIEIVKWHFIENNIKEVFKLYNYKEVRTPVLEFTELFKRGVGEETDIVEKEMYTFNDRNGKSLSLRPEGTASTVRAYIQSKEYSNFPLTKYYYMGEMYRHERPQKGRYRAFNQIGAEFFGPSSPASDFEVIQMLEDILKSIKLKNYKFYINSIGCKECRPSHKKALIDFFIPHKDELCTDCQRRLESNPMRIIDCKVDKCKEIAENAPMISDYYCESCSTHNNELLHLLKNSDINYEIDNKIVRGLDYYVKTTFEVRVSKDILGSQNTIIGGGRYNNLVKELGGPDIDAIGFGMGVERVILALSEEIIEPPLDYAVIMIGKESLPISLKVIHDLRNNGYTVDSDYRLGSMKSQMRWANKNNAQKVIIIGEQEIKEGMYIEKDMLTSEQIKKPFNEV
jgi:histidyl-tRNA synthetase